MKYSFLLLLLLIAHRGEAQPRGEWGVLVGGAAYLGDLNASRYPDTKLLRPAVGLSGGWSIRQAWVLRAHAAYAEIRADDAQSEREDFRLRNFSFNTRLWQGGLQLKWSPFTALRYPTTGGYRNILAPYLFAGVAATHYTVNTSYGLTTTEGQREGVPADQQLPKQFAHTTLPLGTGLQIDLNKKTSIGLEVSWHYAMTDFLDGVHAAGNPERNDWFMLAGLTYTHRFSKADYDRDGILDREDACPRVAGHASARGCPDADGDGVEDLEDLCPDIPGDRAAQGCPDRDFDGIPDKDDRCPSHPGGLATLGCPDTDGDGVADNDDACPDCPGLPEQAGCPDTDGDGLIDSRDRCPQTPGPLAWFGCPFSDRDGDGVPDDEDKCPDEWGRYDAAGCPDDDGDGLPNAEDACPQDAGPAKWNGCPDSDGDGVPDHLDRCPTVAGAADSQDGCPAVPKDVQKILALATKNVQFETASAKLKKSAYEKLDQIVTILVEYPYYHLSIEGHTDSQGAATANQTLSEQRAQSCFDYFVAQGIANQRFKVAGFGESKPIASNRTANGRSLNRRVTFELFIPKN